MRDEIRRSRSSAGRRLRRYAARLVAALGDGGGAALGPRVAGLGCGRRDGAGSDDPRARVRARLRLPPRSCLLQQIPPAAKVTRITATVSEVTRAGVPVPTSSLTAKDRRRRPLAHADGGRGERPRCHGRLRPRCHGSTTPGGAPPSTTSPGHRRALTAHPLPARRLAPGRWARWRSGWHRRPVPGLGRLRRGDDDQDVQPAPEPRHRA